MSAIPQLNSCCCGCSLRTGCLIILWVTLIFYGLACFTPYTQQQLIQQNDQEIKKYSQNGNETAVVELKKNHKTLEIELEKSYEVVVYSSIKVITIALGLFAVYSKRGVFLLPDIVFSIIQIILVVIYVFQIYYTKHSLVVVAFEILINAAIQVYFTLVEFSYYRVLTNPKYSRASTNQV